MGKNFPKMKKVRVNINSKIYAWGHGSLDNESMVNFEETMIRFFEEMGWTLSAKADHSFIVGTSPKMKKADYPKEAYAYLHPLEIVFYCNCDEVDDYLSKFEAAFSENGELAKYGTLYEPDISDIFIMTNEEQVEYLQSIESELIKIIEDYSNAKKKYRSKYDLEDILMNKHRLPSFENRSLMGYCMGDPDGKYIESLVAKYYKEASVAI